MARESMLRHKWLESESARLQEKGVEVHPDVICARSCAAEGAAYAKRVEADLILKDMQARPGLAQHGSRYVHRLVGRAVAGRSGEKGNHLISQVVHSRLYDVCGLFGSVKKGSPPRLVLIKYGEVKGCASYKPRAGI